MMPLFVFVLEKRENMSYLGVEGEGAGESRQKRRALSLQVVSFSSANRNRLLQAVEPH